jgi:hypothetical protein
VGNRRLLFLPTTKGKKWAEAHGIPVESEHGGVGPAADQVRSTNIVASRRIGKLGGSGLSGAGEMEAEPM